MFQSFINLHHKPKCPQDKPRYVKKISLNKVWRTISIFRKANRMTIPHYVFCFRLMSRCNYEDHRVMHFIKGRPFKLKKYVFEEINEWGTGWKMKLICDKHFFRSPDCIYEHYLESKILSDTTDFPKSIHGRKKTLLSEIPRKKKYSHISKSSLVYVQKAIKVNDAQALLSSLLTVHIPWSAVRNICTWAQITWFAFVYKRMTE